MNPMLRTFSHAEAVAPKHNQQMFPGFGCDGFLRLGEPGGYLFLFSFAFCFPITRGLAVPASFHFAFDRITTDLAIVLGGDLVSLDLTCDLEGNLIPLDLALVNCHIAALATASRRGQCSCHFVSFELQLKGVFPIRTAIASRRAPCPRAGRISLLVLGLGHGAERK